MLAPVHGHAPDDLLQQLGASSLLFVAETVSELAVQPHAAAGRPWSGVAAAASQTMMRAITGRMSFIISAAMSRGLCEGCRSNSSIRLRRPVFCKEGAIDFGRHRCSLLGRAAMEESSTSGFRSRSAAWRMLSWSLAIYPQLPVNPRHSRLKDSDDHACIASRRIFARPVLPSSLRLRAVRGAI